jgi:hypothetical protein
VHTIGMFIERKLAPAHVTQCDLLLSLDEIIEVLKAVWAGEASPALCLPIPRMHLLSWLQDGVPEETRGTPPGNNQNSDLYCPCSVFSLLRSNLCPPCPTI